ncbi:MAG: hypothetical protein H0U26_01500 [Acidimicrobiia bacterium]|nr:hypothetical protein [Acidimicrobiia bacterium]
MTGKAVAGLVRRVAVLAAMAGVGAGVVVADRARDSAPAVSTKPVLEAAPAFAMPRAEPVGAPSSTWYCAANGTGSDGAADLTAIVANPGPGERRGTVTWMPDEGDAVAERFRVEGGGVTSLRAREALPAPAGSVSALVDVVGGGAVVEHAVADERGASVAPCASRASDRWYLPNGATTSDARQSLALFNPFPDDAIVDIGIATPDGREAPPRLQGLPVAAGSTTVVEVGEEVRREAVTATSVVARSGQLVVDRIQSFDGSRGRSGLALTLAAPAPSPVWTFPDGRKAEGHLERWHVSNPGEREALVALEVVPDDGAPPPPLEVTVAARGQATILAEDIPELPEGSHTSTVRSLNDVNVVAERELQSDLRTLTGWSSALGSPLGAKRWALAAGEVSDDVGEEVVVANPGPLPVDLSVTAFADGRPQVLTESPRLVLGPADRISLRLRDVVEGDAVGVVVAGDGPLVVERSLQEADGTGFSRAMGIPLS